MVFRASGGSLGPLLGALGGLLGASWAPLRCSLGSLGNFLGAKEPSWAPLGCSCCPSSRLLSFDLLRSRCFCMSWSLFGSILGLQDDPPTLKNRAPASAAARFLKNRRFRSEDGLESAWGLYWACFGCSRGLLGSPFGGLGGFLGAPGGYQASFKVIMELSLASFWRLRCPSS